MVAPLLSFSLLMNLFCCHVLYVQSQPTGVRGFLQRIAANGRTYLANHNQGTTTSVGNWINERASDIRREQRVFLTLPFN